MMERQRSKNKKSRDFSKLKRRRYPMPDFVKHELQKWGVVQQYKMRPPYQQNDYVGWIMRGKREVTRQKRLKQMIDELFRGDKYMNMPYKA